MQQTECFPSNPPVCSSIRTYNRMFSQELTGCIHFGTCNRMLFQLLPVCGHFGTGTEDLSSYWLSVAIFRHAMEQTTVQKVLKSSFCYEGVYEQFETIGLYILNKLFVLLYYSERSCIHARQIIYICGIAPINQFRNYDFMGENFTSVALILNSMTETLDLYA